MYLSDLISLSFDYDDVFRCIFVLQLCHHFLFFKLFFPPAGPFAGVLKSTSIADRLTMSVCWKRSVQFLTAFQSQLTKKTVGWVFKNYDLESNFAFPELINSQNRFGE